MTWLDDLVKVSAAKVDDRVREALWARGVSDSQIHDFQVGHVGRKLPDIDYPAEFVEWSWKGRRIEDCYVFPLTNPLGELKGVQFRAVDRDKKNYADYFLGRPDEAIMFGAHQAMPYIWETSTITATEGVFDFFPVQRVFPNTVATMTARFNEEFVRLLRRLVKTVYLVYDNDKTGREAVERFIRYNGKDFTTHVLQYPRVLTAAGKPVKDPGDLWELWGDERFAAFLRCIENPVGIGV